VQQPAPFSGTCVVLVGIGDGTDSVVEPLVAHIPLVSPSTGHMKLPAVAPPAQVPGFCGSQAVHSQNPKFPMVDTNDTTFEDPSGAEP